MIKNMYAIFMNWTYTYILSKPFPNFSKVNGVNGGKIGDVNFTGGGSLLSQSVAKKTGVLKGYIGGDVIYQRPLKSVYRDVPSKKWVSKSISNTS